MPLPYLKAITALIAATAALIRAISLATVLILHPAPASEPPISPPCHLDSSPRTSCGNSAAGYRCA